MHINSMLVFGELGENLSFASPEVLSLVTVYAARLELGLDLMTLH